MAKKGERLFPLVRSHVTLKASYEIVSPSTLKTGERLLLEVSFSMHFKEILVFKTLPTLLAFKIVVSCMNSHVSIKLSFMYETLSTLRAAERLLSGVNFHVVSK